MRSTNRQNKQPWGLKEWKPKLTKTRMGSRWFCWSTLLLPMIGGQQRVFLKPEEPGEVTLSPTLQEFFAKPFVTIVWFFLMCYWRLITHLKGARRPGVHLPARLGARPVRQPLLCLHLRGPGHQGHLQLGKVVRVKVLICENRTKWFFSDLRTDLTPRSTLGAWLEKIKKKSQRIYCIVFLKRPFAHEEEMKIKWKTDII